MIRFVLKPALLPLTLLMLVAAAGAPAQNFPEKNITLLHAYSPGSSSAVLLRALADSAGKTLGKKIVVEDKPGAGGALAPTIVHNTGKPDGYLLTQMPQPILRIPHIQKTEFDVINDFTWIIRIVDYTYALIVRNESPYRNISDFIKDARANQGKLTYASSGVGVTMHMTMEELAQRAGIKLVHVPIRVSGDMLNALIGGHIDVSASSVHWAPLVDAGKIRVLGVFSPNRLKRWPDLPTAKEQGFDVNASSSYGIGGPKGMDPKVVKILHDAFRKALDDPEFLKTVERYDLVLSYLNTADYTKWAREQYAAEKLVVEKFGLKQ
jgi:tripartite-type tricarboxylate transporter receptor subunit TctC